MDTDGCFCLIEDGKVVRTDDLCPLHSKRPGIRDDLQRAETELKQAGQIASRLLRQTWEEEKMAPGTNHGLLGDLHDLITAQSKALNAIRRLRRQ